MPILSPFRAQKFTFNPAVIDIEQSIQFIDDRRAYALFALTLMTKSPAEVWAISGRLGQNKLEHLLAAFEECVESFAALSEMMSSAHARLTAAKTKLI